MTTFFGNTALAVFLVAALPALAGRAPECHDHGGSACLTEAAADPAHIALGADEFGWTDGPASLPTGAQVAILEGNPAEAAPFTMRLKFPAGFRIPPHTHPAIEHVTVLSGTFGIGIGETFDPEAGRELTAGGFVVLPAGHAHFAWAQEETVVQLHGVGPWGISYLDPADDPRAH